MSDFLSALLNEPWWVYDAATASAWGRIYHWFNLFEGCCWIVFAVLVLKRWSQRHHSLLEVAYALTFLVFGLTDFREAYVQSARLVLAKGVVLVLLLWQRHFILKRYYPDAWF